jgi:TRAP-type C4-dicarboxylate transport system permease small subunit
MILMVVIVFIQVIARYIFNNSLSWSEELVRYIFIWQVWLGASMGMRTHEHIRVDMFLKLLPGIVRKLLDLLIIILILWLYWFCIRYGFIYLRSVISKSMKSTALQLPLAYVYASLPIGSTIIAIRFVALFFSKLAALFRASDGAKTNDGGETA